ncbi:hypothetical protein ACPPVS_12625 [Cellulomonas sp. McL0617]|uniref:hypothetical protein n=1 Tax=Cellulomonas sp. McL0617 TaxID=3415675 RepID=UPI003CFACF28
MSTTTQLSVRSACGGLARGAGVVMSQRHSTARAAGTTFIVIAAAMLSACTTARQPEPATSATVAVEASPTPTATPTPTLSAEQSAAQAAILAAYHGYWDAKVAAFANTTVDPGAELRKFAVDTALADVIEGVYTFRRSGIVVTGAPTLDPEVSDIVVGDGGKATIVDCVDGAAWTPIYSDSGKSAAAPGLATRLVTTSTALYYDNRWTIQKSAVDHDTTC